MIGKLLIVFSLAAGLMLLTTNSAVSVADEETTTIQGTVVCLGCTLKKTEGANAACKIYGHKHGLATEDGDLYSFLENKNSEEVINSDKYAMKEVVVRIGFGTVILFLILGLVVLLFSSRGQVEERRTWPSPIKGD